MEDAAPSLGVGFEIEYGGSIGALARVDAAMDATHDRVLAGANDIERATGSMIDTRRATAQIIAFGDATSREMRRASTEKKRLEDASERMIRQLDREAAALGKTRDELRDTRVEELALHAAKLGNLELADRLLASSRGRQAASDAAAEAAAEKKVAEERARVLEVTRRQAIAERELIAEQRRQNDILAERANIEAALERTTGVGRVRATDAGASTYALSKMLIEEEAAALRAAAHAHEMFEARVRQGVQAMRDQAEAARAAGIAEKQLATDAQMLRSAMDPMYAAQVRFDDELQRAERLLAAGVFGQKEYAQSVQMSRDALYQHAQSVAGANAGAHQLEDANRRVGQSLTQLSFQGNDAITMLLSGSSAFQVVATQGGQVFQVFQQAQGGAKGLASELGTLAMRWAPLAGIIAISVGALLAAGAAWHEYAGAIHEFEALAQGAGRAALLTAQDMEQIAEGAARAGNVTVVAAREIETGYVRLGGIGKPVMQDLILLTRDFAAATGTDAAGATQTLGAAFQDPIKGAQDLATKFGALSQAQVEHIRQLVEQNDLYGAQVALLKGLEPAFDGAADHASKLTLAWRSIRDAASEAWTEMGRAIDLSLGGGGTLGELQRLQAKADQERWVQTRFGGSVSGQYDAEIARLKAQLERERTAANNGQARSRASATMAIVDNVTGASGLADMRANLGRINGMLADNGVAAGLTADQLARARTAQAQYNNAIRTYIPEGERQVRLAKLDVELARAKDAKDNKRVATLTAQRTELQNRCKLITATQAQELATASGTRATLEASDSVDRHAQRLQDEAKAIARQTANTYAMADAYAESGAAALIAEARTKAESDAIKKRGDIEASVARQVNLSIAQRVADSAKSVAGMRDQAEMQERANAAMRAGSITTGESQQMVRDWLEDLPLLAAANAAAAIKDETSRARALKQLDDQRAARVRLTDAERDARFLSAMETSDDRLADIREELRLVGATEAVRVRSLAIARAEREVRTMSKSGKEAADYVKAQGDIADGQFQIQLRTKAVNDELTHQGLLFDTIATNAGNAARGMSDAFGEAGRALGDMGAIFAGHIADQQRLTAARDAELKAIADMTDQQLKAQRTTQINDLFARRSSAAQVGFYGDMTNAAKGFFDEKSKGYAALSIAEKAFRAVEFAMSVRAIAQDAIETGAKIATSIARTATKATEAVVTAISTLPFPANIAAGAATAAALAALGVSVVGSFGGSSRNRLDKANDGSGSVLGDTKAQSESIKRAIDQLREVDTLTNGFAREMAASLRSIDSQIGGVATAVVRAGDMGPAVRTGFQSDATGTLLQGVTTGWGVYSKIPIIGGIIGGIGKALGSLFGASTSVIASGLSAKSQTVGSIMAGGFDASTYADVEKKKKFLGITTGKSYSTKYGDADADLEKQFTLLLGSFASAIGSAAGPLGESTAAVEARLSSFVVDIGKIDLKGLTGEQIAEKLTAVFGAAADKMADAAFPGIDRFQKVGEGAFETLVRVASTVEAVTVSLDQLGMSARALGIDAKMGLADQFDSVSAMNSAVDTYFKAFYSPAEQNAARMRQLDGVFVRMGTAMPTTIASFRSLVEAQDLTTAAGQATYATLLQIAPAFAELKAAMDGAKSAADVLAEREGLQRRLLELNGDTAAIHALELAKLDASNRALQLQIYAIEDAKEAARAADDLRQAWKSVGDSLLDEVKRIRGLDTAGGGSFATMLGAFNAATTSARSGDIDAAKSLPGLSQALLKAAAEQATSRQELARIEAQIAASLEATQATIAGRSAAATNAAILAASATAAAANQPAANDSAASMASQIEALRQEVAGMRSENAAGHAATAGAAGRAARVLEAVSADSGGDAITVANVA